jgi:hypothetical protein
MYKTYLFYIAYYHFYWFISPRNLQPNIHFEETLQNIASHNKIQPRLRKQPLFIIRTAFVQEHQLDFANTGSVKSPIPVPAIFAMNVHAKCPHAAEQMTDPAAFRKYIFISTLNLWYTVKNNSLTKCPQP